jgi:hypothetical protein
MSQTSSPTSSRRSPGFRRKLALAAWATLALGQIALVWGANVALDETETAGLEPFYEYGTAIGNTVVYGILVGLTVAIARLVGDPADALGLRTFAGRWVWAALGVVLAAGLVTVVLALVTGVDAGEEQGYLPDTWRPDRAGAIAANALVAVLVAPLGEELFFRGLGVSVLSVFGSAAAVVVSGLAFGLAHGLLVGLLPLALFGVGLAWVRMRARSVWPGFVAHAAYNGAALALGLACLSDPACRGEALAAIL